jgi:hypothetical protein
MRDSVRLLLHSRKSVFMKRTMPLLAIMVSLGCQAKEEPTQRERAERPAAVAPPSLVKIQGSITLDDKPLGGGMVMFLPEDDEKGRPASGAIDPDGTFELGTASPGDGIVPGKYRIVVTPPSTPGIKAPANRKAVPARYSDPEKTPLRSTIKTADQKVQLDMHS